MKWKVHGRCVEGAWKVHGRCTGGVQKVHGRCIERCNANDLIGWGENH